jgi:hypothetical protein
MVRGSIGGYRRAHFDECVEYESQIYERQGTIRLTQATPPIRRGADGLQDRMGI